MGSRQWDWDNVTIVMAASSPLVSAQSLVTSCPPPEGERSPLPPARHLPRQRAQHEPVALTPRPAGQQAFPPLASQAANLFQAAVAFVGDGCALVDDAEFRRRLEICRGCDRRAGKRCTACGCWIGVKARGRAFACPLGRWERQGR